MSELRESHRNTNPDGVARGAHGDERREPKRAEVTIVTSAPGDTPQTHIVRVSVPSSRLRTAIAFSWFGQGDGPNLSTSSVTLVPLVSDKGGDEGPLPATLTNQALPYGLDLASSVDAYRATLTIVRPSGTLAGKLKAVAKWEPTNEMSTEEWEAVQKLCSLMLLSAAGKGISA